MTTPTEQAAAPATAAAAAPVMARADPVRDRLAVVGRWLGERARRLSPADAGAALLYLGFALVLTHRLWGSAATAENPRDHAQFLFFFEHAANAVTHGHNPLFTTLMGAPDGVNLMSNTAFLGAAVPLIPVTLLLGSAVSYGLTMTLGLAGTALAWYVVLRRHVTTHRGVAFAAAALCGFGPGIAGHLLGHPNFVAQFLLPLIVSGVARLPSAARPVRSGLVLGLLVAYQVFLNEELLFLTAIACLLMVVVAALSHPTRIAAQAPRFLAGLGVAAGVVVVLAGYPLWFQFAGPQHAVGPIYWAGNWYNDLAGLPGLPREGIAGWLGVGSPYNNAVDETNGFLGLPLLALALVTAVALWRRPASTRSEPASPAVGGDRTLAVRIALVVTVVGLALSLGDPIRVQGTDTIPGPYHLVRHLWIFDSVIASRFALLAGPAAAVLLACAGDRLASLLPERETAARLLLGGVVAAVLLPLAPMPVRTVEPMPVPAFFTDGTWRSFASTGTIVPVPPGTASESTLRWILATDLQVRFVDGYFLGPTSYDDPVMRYGPPDRPTRKLLQGVADNGWLPTLSAESRATARADLRFWQADALVLWPQQHNADLLRQTVDDLLGRPGVYLDGVWVWEVRDLR